MELRVLGQSDFVFLIKKRILKPLETRSFRTLESQIIPPTTGGNSSSEIPEPETFQGLKLQKIFGAMRRVNGYKNCLLVLDPKANGFSSN
uniref:Uncharacterized protein n=1 Tax=Romanomermis culicivorax TaxID=13658 RepID=A0A915JYX5_ROMCU